MLVHSLHSNEPMRVLERILCVSLLLVAACASEISTGGGGGSDVGVDAGPPPPPPPPTTKTADQLITDWSGCMTLANFTQAKMNTAWGNLAASTGNACASCHSDGFEGFYVNTDANLMFTALSTSKAFLAVYFSADVTNQKVIVDSALFAAVGAGTGSFAGHPQFPTNNAGILALNNFYQLTLTAQQAGTCGPPTAK